MSQPSEPLWGPPRTQLMGTGDGCTTSFYNSICGPIMPGSVIVRVINPDAIARMAALQDPMAVDMACHDIAKDGIFYGQLDNGSVDYVTGAVNVTWQTAPQVNARIEIIWRREKHPLEGCKVRVKDKNGKKHWITPAELSRLTFLAN